MNTTLVIMAAGIGSRFGGGIKQLKEVCRTAEVLNIVQKSIKRYNNAERYILGRKDALVKFKAA